MSTSSAKGFSRRAAFYASAFFITSLVGLSQHSLAQTPHAQGRSCGSPSLPACPALPPVIGPWVYTLELPGGGGPGSANVHSFADVNQLVNQIGTTNDMWCTTSNTSITEGATGWGITGPVYTMGIYYEDAYT